MAKYATPFRNHTVPMVGQAAQAADASIAASSCHGDVQFKTWGGPRYIEPAKEERLPLLLAEIRA
jgi:hypothetical protein